MNEAIYYFAVMIGMMTLGKWVMYYFVMHHLKYLNIQITDEQKKRIKWLTGSVIYVLTGYFYILYFLLLR